MKLNRISILSKFQDLVSGLVSMFLNLAKIKVQKLKRSIILRKLITFETIEARTFYKILESSLFQLLLKKVQKSVSPLSLKIMESYWYTILETYYQKTNPSHLQFLREIQQKDKKLNEINTLQAGLTLARLRVPYADEVFKEFGFEGKSIEYIERQVKIKRTKLNLLLNNFDKQSKEEVKENFYSLKARYGSVIGNIPVNVLLVEWIGVIDAIKEMNKANAKTK